MWFVASKTQSLVPVIAGSSANTRAGATSQPTIASSR
jgi:hypothetical protein